MPGLIFYRERLKVGKEEKKPRFIVVAIAGIDMKVYGQHLRKKELELIASAVDAKLVFLKHGKKEKDEAIPTTKKKAGKKK
jgi:hypothetical protein